jgi:hypothetical protein
MKNVKMSFRHFNFTHTFMLSKEKRSKNTQNKLNETTFLMQ